jgi:hypothetical protein
MPHHAHPAEPGLINAPFHNRPLQRAVHLAMLSLVLGASVGSTLISPAAAAQHTVEHELDDSRHQCFVRCGPGAGQTVPGRSGTLFAG